MANVAGDRCGGAAPARPLFIDFCCDGVANVGLAAGNHDIGTILRHAAGDGLADAFGRAGDESGLPRKIEKIVHVCLLK